MRWAAVKPDLGAVSLKPYLFEGMSGCDPQTDAIGR
jgi:hypothetical protein